MNIKRKIAYNLRNLGDWLEQHCSSLADWIDEPLIVITQHDLDLSTESIMAKVRLKIEHPCLDCRGEGALSTPDGLDVYTCPACKGLGVDLRAVKT